MVHQCYAPDARSSGVCELDLTKQPYPGCTGRRCQQIHIVITQRDTSFPIKQGNQQGDTARVLSRAKSAGQFSPLIRSFVQSHCIKITHFIYILDLSILLSLAVRTEINMTAEIWYFACLNVALKMKTQEWGHDFCSVTTIISSFHGLMLKFLSIHNG